MVSLHFYMQNYCSKNLVYALSMSAYYKTVDPSETIKIYTYTDR